MNPHYQHPLPLHFHTVKTSPLDVFTNLDRVASTTRVTWHMSWTEDEKHSLSASVSKDFYFAFLMQNIFPFTTCQNKTLEEKIDTICSWLIDQDFEQETHDVERKVYYHDKCVKRETLASFLPFSSHMYLGRLSIEFTLSEEACDIDICFEGHLTQSATLSSDSARSFLPILPSFWNMSHVNTFRFG